MNKDKETTPPCDCQTCSCRRGPRCRCHDYNALLALGLWDFGQMLRRQSSPSAARVLERPEIHACHARP